MSTPPRAKREPVCPPAPKRLSREELNAERARKDEVRRKLMAIEAVDKVVYLQAIREYVKSTKPIFEETKDELMAFLNAKIQDLEVDALGSPRYSYNLHYPTDIGFAPNGRQPVFADKKFSTADEVSEFIRDYIKSDEMTFDKDAYNLPSTSFIEEMLENSSKLEIDVNDEEEDESEEKVPSFTLTRTRINY
jgi:hypothetical protein